MLLYSIGGKGSNCYNKNIKQIRSYRESYIVNFDRRIME